MKTVFILLSAVLSAASATADSYNDFDVSKMILPLDKIRSGGPPRDGIPAIDHPRFIRPSKADFMRDDDEVLSVTIGGETRAYPLRILVWHEMVNDELGGEPIVVTYCPLCGTAMVFSRQIGARILDFGVSGLLYQSDVLMYDRQTESLWSQLGMKAVSGPLVETSFDWLVSEQSTWLAWKKKYPEGRVLSTDTGVPRDYSREGYTGYKQSLSTLFPVPSYRTELPQKEWVFGVLLDGAAYAYPISVLTEHRTITDGLLKIIYDPDTRLATVINRETGEVLPVVKIYWFAWQAFYPETKVWK